MTVSTLTNKVTYQGNGSATSFTVPFKVLDEDHLVVQRRVEATGEIEYTYVGTDYSYNGIGDDSGTLTLDGPALSSTYELVIERIVPYTQDLDIVNSGGFYPETVEEQFDRTTMQIQQVAAQADDVESRALRVPEGQTIGLLPPLDELKGKFIAIDAEGDPIGSSGTGSDSGLRTDLAGSGGGDLVRFDPAGDDAVDRSTQGRMLDTISLLDFIPVAEHAAIRGRTSTTDLADYFDAAFAHITALKALGLAMGAELYIPAGRYTCGSTITVPSLTRIRGAGEYATIIQFTHAGTDVTDGSGFKVVGVPNSTSVGGYHVSDLRIEMTHASNKGACWYDAHNHLWTISNCHLIGGKYGVVLDQSETWSLKRCYIAAQLLAGAGVWLVNGEDITPGNSGDFTNVGTIDHCDFNYSTPTNVDNPYAIVHDGGYNLIILGGNFNGAGIRAAGVRALNIVGAYFESVNFRSAITLTNTTRAGANIGSASGFATVRGCYYNGAGFSFINIGGWNQLLIEQILTANSVGTYVVTGMANLSSLFSRQIVALSGAAPFDGYAVSIHDDGAVRINTDATTARTLSGADIHALTRCTHASGCTVTVPPVATAGWSVGHRIMLGQGAAGVVTLAAGAGVTLEGTTVTNAQHQRLDLIMYEANKWNIIRGT